MAMLQPEACHDDGDGGGCGGYGDGGGDGGGGGGGGGGGYGEGGCGGDCGDGDDGGCGDGGDADGDDGRGGDAQRENFAIPHRLHLSVTLTYIHLYSSCPAVCWCGVISSIDMTPHQHTAGLGVCR